MNRILTLSAVVGALVAVTVDASQARHRYYQPNPFAAPISYDHNYGPGPLPGTFAFYDGPLRANCKQSAAAYRGQDGRRHPCN